ncbi:MAG TPA: hypothetical protein VGR37_17815 [Longimicrobiaceae bacterium]|nr:hypothetical protein [Longimicrobiaceae bacterium]
MLADFDALGLEREGLGIWRALRRVRGWYGAPPEGSTPETADAERVLDEVDAGLRPSLRVLRRLLREPEPDDDTLEAVALACYHAALWAEERGAYRTAVGLLHAAEDVYPDNAHYAYNLGRVARKMALYEDAEAWLKWAHFVARSSGNWEVATLALSGLGNLHRQRGNLPKARRFHEAARRLARLRGLRTLEGDALYDLCVISLSAGEDKPALELARQALAAYGPGHGQVYRLANDMAWYWMDRYGEFTNAAHVFTALLEYIWGPPFRVLLHGNLTRAAAGAGWTDVFEQMWIETWVLVRQQMNRQGHSAALTQIALGAGNLGQWERAAFAASEALEVARERKEGEMILLAESIIGAVRSEVIADEAMQRVFKDRDRMLRQQADQDTADLVAAFANAMRARRDAAPESPTHALISHGVS